MLSNPILTGFYGYFDPKPTDLTEIESDLGRDLGMYLLISMSDGITYFNILKIESTSFTIDRAEDELEPPSKERIVVAYEI